MKRNEFLLGEKFIVPSYDREKLQTSILHMGTGAFHRAHQAYINEQYIKQTGDLKWGIVGSDLMSATLAAKLKEQDYLYTLVTKGAKQDDITIIGCIKDMYVGVHNSQALLAKMCDPSIRIVTLTITEKGYYRKDKQSIQIDNEAIQHDLQNPNEPKTAIGYLVHALDIRRKNSILPFTPLSCDNLPQNGATLKAMVLSFAKEYNQELYQWIKENVPFPCSMVDRITPATTQEDIEKLEKTGIQDAAPVVTEPFLQWVIEDKFVNGRPDWDILDSVQFVKDVAVFEEMKLRLLNGTHSTQAYLGYLAKYPYIATCMQDLSLQKLIRTMMDTDITPSLTCPPGINLDKYKDSLIERYKNPSICHRTWQIAMDGSEKLPQRILNPIREQLAKNKSITYLSLAVAAWIRYVSGIDEDNNKIDVRDPLADELRAIAEKYEYNKNINDMLQAYLNIESIFSSDLPQNEKFVSSVTSWLTKLYEEGARVVIAKAATQI